MRSFNPTIIVLLLAMSLFAGSPVLADRYSGGGGYKGGYTQGRGHYSGYYRGGGGHHGGGYYRGGGYYYGPGFGVTIGSPWYFPPYYYPYGYPYSYPYYYPPAVTFPSEPQEYIEKPRSEEQPDPSGVWYYCPESKMYYPYVRECPGGWQTVPVQPSSEPRR